MKANKAYLISSADQLNKSSDNTYYTLTTKPQSALALFFHILAYITSNYTYFVIPLVLLPAIFKKELGKDYPYKSSLHQLVINTASCVLIILVVLFAIY